MTVSCYCESCPEAVPTVNVYQTTIEVDGADSGFADEYFGSGDITGGTITLAHTPLNAASVVLYNNGVALSQDGGDYSVSGAVITLNFAVEAADEIHVHYFWTT